MATKYIVRKIIKCLNCPNFRPIGYIYSTHLDINQAHREVARQNTSYRCSCRCEVIEMQES